MKIKKVNELLTIDVNDITSYNKQINEMIDELNEYKKRMSEIKVKMDSNTSNSSSRNTAIDEISSHLSILSKNLNDCIETSNKIINKIDDLSAGQN